MADFHVKRYWGAFIFIFLPSFLPQTVFSETDAFLVIDSGMHHAPIWRIGASNNCAKIATASKDKTVKLWEPPKVNDNSPTLVKTLRATIGKGNEGKFRSVAVSPDGDVIAAGAASWDPKGGGPWIYIFDVKTGDILNALPIPDSPNDLTFSGDGKRLAVALWGGNGYKVWDVENWKDPKIIGGENYPNLSKSGSPAHSYGIAFDKNDRIYTLAYDGYLRRYVYDGDSKRYLLDPSGTVFLETAEKPYSLAIHPQNPLIAVTYNVNDNPFIEVYSTDNLIRGPVYQAEGKETDVFLAVTWSKDGTRLFGGGKPENEFEDGRTPYPLYYWQDPGFKFPDSLNNREKFPVRPETKKILEGPTNSVIDLIPCGDVQTAFGSHAPSFYVLDEEGKRLFGKEPNRADMRGKLENDFMISEDGSRVRFNLTFGGQDDFMEFDVEELKLGPNFEKAKRLFPANTDSLNIDCWKECEFKAPTFDGIKIPWKDPNEMPRSLAINAKTNHFVIGAEWSVNFYDQKSALIKRTPGPSVVWGVNVSQDGKLMVAAYGDGTIRWHRLSENLEELLAFYIFPQNPKYWVLWTPKGYYKASGGGEMIGWHINRGRKESAKFNGIGKFRKDFNRPDIVQIVLQTLDEEKAITKANAILNLPRAKEAKVQEWLPKVRIDSRKKGENIKNSKVNLVYDLEEPPGKEPIAIEVQVNGRPVERFLHVEGNQSHTIDVCGGISSPKETQINIELIPFIRDQPGISGSAEFVWTGEGKCTNNPSAPNLFAVLVGVNYQSRPGNRLYFAANDANKVEMAFKALEGSIFQKVYFWPYINSSAKKEDILQGLTALNLQSQKEEHKNDIFLFFFSGHGINGPTRDFQLLAMDGPISEDNFVGLIRRTNGKKIIMIDACRSGSLDIAHLENTIRDNDQVNGTVFIASSPGPKAKPNQTDSFECPFPGTKDCQNGYFTLAFLSGLQGEADHPQNGFVDTSEITSFIRGKVMALTKDLQEPVYYATPKMFHFNIGLNSAYQAHP
ncbi:MAG: caspase family protein [Nitrospirales bacterium]|nr:caspase family protein [Nitrospirales bacterium]